MDAVEGGGERLRAEVGRELGLAGAAQEVGEQGGDVTAVEEGEDLGLRSDREEQVVVGAGGHLVSS